MDIIAIGASKRAINQAVSGLYKPAGVIAFANLPIPSNSNLGFTYTVEDAFTSDSRFTDYDSTTQTGHDFPAGSEVAVIVTGTAESPVYKYNVLGGIMDGYATKADVAAIINDATASSTSTYSSNKINTEIAAEEIANNVSGDDISVTDSADANVQKMTVYGESRKSKNLYNVNGTDTNKGYLDNTYIISADGTLEGHATAWSISEYISVVPTTDYYLSNVNGTSVYLCFYDSSKSVLGGVKYSNRGNFKFTTVQNTAYVRLSIFKANANTIQLELGSEQTEYESYFSGIKSIGDSGSLIITTANSDSTANSTATLTTGLPLCGVPVDGGETYTDGNGQKWLADSVDDDGVVKRVYKVTFDGSEDENWGVNSDSATGTSGSKRLYLDMTHHPAKAYSTSTIAPLVCNNMTPSSPCAMYSLDVDNVICVYYNSTNNNNRVYIRVNGISTAAALKTYLASNPVTVVYELATPTTQELTSVEKSALLNLKTFDSTTNLTITDDPFVDFGYIKNTDNGKAVEQAAENVIAQIPFLAGSWITDIPEMHRNIFRGQSLGSSVTAAQLAAIQDGSFDDLYIGDYWTINNVVWRIADIDHYLNKGASYQLTAHHLVIMPDTTIDTAAMGSTAYRAVRSTIMANAKATVNAAFPDMVIPYSEIFGFYNDSLVIDDSEVDIPDVLSVTGNMLMRRNDTTEHTHTMSFQQFALFKLAPKFIVSNAVFWTRNITTTNSSEFIAIDTSGRLGLQNFQNAAGVRPYFLIGVSEEEE